MFDNVDEFLVIFWSMLFVVVVVDKVNRANYHFEPMILLSHKTNIWLKICALGRKMGIRRVPCSYDIIDTLSATQNASLKYQDFYLLCEKHVYDIFQQNYKVSDQ